MCVNTVRAPPAYITWTQSCNDIMTAQVSRLARNKMHRRLSKREDRRKMKLRECKLLFSISVLLMLMRVARYPWHAVFSLLKMTVDDICLLDYFDCQALERDVPLYNWQYFCRPVLYGNHQYYRQILIVKFAASQLLACSRTFSCLFAAGV